MTTHDPRTPVLVGAGVASQRQDDPLLAMDALGLMQEAVHRAGVDCGMPSLLADVGEISVPNGRWTYGNPAGAIARQIGAAGAVTVRASVGVLQQSLLSRACGAIADGRMDAALVVGGDAGYRIVRSQITGTRIEDTPDEGVAEISLTPAEELRHPAELQAGLRAPMGLYAMIESAYRARHRWTLADHQDRIARLYSRFTEIAAGNKHAWKQEVLTPEAIREPSPRNPVQAFPYNKLHCSFWNVDQAAALLFCSIGKAQALGIPRDRWIFPLAASESNHMVTVSARRALSECPGAGVAGRAALAAAHRHIDDIDLIELYSCFPAAVEIYASELGLSLDRDLTVTGGMPFAGGPYNNYVLQATCRMAELLRSGRGRTGLISSVSGVVTKQAFGLWSTEPGRHGYAFCDVSAEVERLVARKPVLPDFAGPGRIAGHTVIHERGKPARAIVIADVAADGRIVAMSEAADIVARFQETDVHGCDVQVSGGRFMI